MPHIHNSTKKSKGGRYARGGSRGARGAVTSNQTVEHLIVLSVQFHIITMVN